MNADDVFKARDLAKMLEEAKASKTQDIDTILAKGAKKKGLDLNEVATLLNVENKPTIEKIFKTAAGIKEEIYGERVVLFAPLYASNYCVNDCEYCGFHARNKSLRKKLNLEEVAEQVKHIIDMGHKRILLEFGEDSINNPIGYVLDVLRTIYKTTSGRGQIRRVNVNIAATTVGNYRKLKKAGIGTYQLFQETYHRPTFDALHRGPKANYERQLFAHNKAFEGGIDDIGLGVLFGLYDYRFEVMALVAHAKYLERKFAVGPHTVSVPRFQPADTVKLSRKHLVSDSDFLKLVAIIRIALPYTGMIISTRERPEIRMKAIKIAISQASGGSRTSPGGYGHKEQLEQFQVADERSLDDIVLDLLNNGFMPSFCTACYRSGRTGDKFMELAKPGEIQKLCRPNAMLTFQEYLQDYASTAVKEAGKKLQQKLLDSKFNAIELAKLEQKLAGIINGERDIYY